jgi:hypothetical protein
MAPPKAKYVLPRREPQALWQSRSQQQTPLVHRSAAGRCRGHEEEVTRFSSMRSLSLSLSLSLSTYSPGRSGSGSGSGSGPGGSFIAQPAHGAQPRRSSAAPALLCPPSEMPTPEAGPGLLARSRSRAAGRMDQFPLPSSLPQRTFCPTTWLPQPPPPPPPRCSCCLPATCGAALPCPACYLASRAAKPKHHVSFKGRRGVGRSGPRDTGTHSTRPASYTARRPNFFGVTMATRDRGRYAVFFLTNCSGGAATTLPAGNHVRVGRRLLALE